MNSNGNKAEAILYETGGAQALSANGSPPPGASKSNVLPFSGRPHLTAVKQRRRESYAAEKEEIQDAMDCLIRLKAIITLREADSTRP